MSRLFEFLNGLKNSTAVVYIPLNVLTVDLYKTLENSLERYLSIYVISERKYYLNHNIPSFIKKVDGIIVNKVPKGLFFDIFDAIEESKVYRSAIPLGLKSALVIGLTRYLYHASLVNYIPLAFRDLPDPGSLALRNLFDDFLSQVSGTEEGDYVLGFIGGRRFERRLH